VSLGKVSQNKLSTCHVELQRFVRALEKSIDADPLPHCSDITVLCGWRGKEEQDEAFRRGTSKLVWPKSKHNRMPYSLAVDLAPYPVDWKNTAGFEELRKRALQVATAEDVHIRVISWDLPHYELAYEPA
jgi:peptidoglycan L-alanyl-D-glutamate endopeptidase CwlK